MGCTSDKRANSLKQELIDGGLWNLDTVSSSKWMAIKASMSEDFRPELTFTNETIVSFDKVGLESEAELSTLKESMKKVLEDKKLTKKEREVYNTSSEYFRENRSKKVSEAIGKPVQAMKLLMLPFDLIAGIIDNAVTSTGKELPFVVKIFEKNKVSVSNMILGNGPRGSLPNQLAQSYNSAIKTEESHYSPNNVVNVLVDSKSNVYDEVTGGLIGEYRKLYKATEAGSIIIAKAGKNITEKYDKNELAIEENLVKNGYIRNDVLVPSENKKHENYIGVWTKDGVDYEFKDDKPTFQEIQDIASGKKQINYTGDVWGDKANTGNYTSNDTVMVSGSGPWRGVVPADINKKFESFYKPLLTKVTEAGSTIVVGNAKGIDQLVINYLETNGYNVSFNNEKNHWEADKKDSEINSEIAIPAPKKLNHFVSQKREFNRKNETTDEKSAREMKALEDIIELALDSNFYSRTRTEENTELEEVRDHSVLIQALESFTVDGTIPAGFFDAPTNKIYLPDIGALEQLTEEDISILAAQYGISIDNVKGVINHIIKNDDLQAHAHESIHGMTLYYMMRNLHDKEMQSLIRTFDKLKKNVDSLDNYWKTDVFEFIAEYMTQPKLREDILTYEQGLIDADNGIVAKILKFIKDMFRSNLAIKEKDNTFDTKAIVDTVMSIATVNNIETDRVNKLQMYEALLYRGDKMSYLAMMSEESLAGIESWLTRNKEEQGVSDIPLPSEIAKDIDKWLPGHTEPVTTTETKGSSDNGLGLTDEDELIMEYDMNKKGYLAGIFNEMMSGDSEGHSNSHFTQKYLTHVVDTINTFEAILSGDEKNKGSRFSFYQREEEGSQTKAEYTKRLNSDGTYTTSIDILYHDGDTTATASEMYLHEATHQFVNGAFELNPSLKKEAEIIRQKIMEEGLLDYSIFLAKVKSPTDTEIARAKEKFDYIFSPQSSTEEFLAYATSNSLLYEALSKIDLSKKSEKEKYKESGADNIIEILSAIFKDLASVYADVFNGIDRTKNGAEVIKSTINSIGKYNLKMQALGENPRLMRRLGFTGFAEASGLNTYILHADELIGKLEAIDIKINPKLDRAIRTVGSITYSFYKDNLKEGTVGALESIAKIKSVEKILDTRLVQNIGEQLFGRTKFKHGTAQFYQMYRQAKLLTDSYVNTSKGEIRRSLNDKSLFHPLNEVEAQVFNNTIIATGMHEFMANKTGENMTRESIDRQLVSLRAKMHGKMSQREVSHLEALGKHTLDGKAHIENQQINAYNVLRNATHPDLEIDKDAIKLAKEFVSMYALSQTSDGDIEKLKEMLSNPEFKDDILKTSLYYSKLIKSLEVTYMSKDSSYFPVPHNFTHKSTTGKSKVLSLIHRSDYSEGKSLYGNVEIHEKIKILGEEFYKVSYIEPSNQFDEGMLNSVAFQTKGLSIRDALKRVYMEKRYDSDFDSTIENSNQFADKYMSSYSWRKHLNSSDDYTGSAMTMPIKGENGALKDIIIPFSKTDESIIMAKDNYSVETLSATLSRALDIMTAKNNNAKAIILLNQFYQENKGNKSHRFIELSKFKTGKEWNKLSPTIKAMITDLSDEEEALMIPSKLWELIVGSDQSSLSNLKVMGKEIFKSFTSKKNVRFLEDIVASIFQKNKTALILFNPDVFSGNMISNMHIAYSQGVPPTKFMPQFKTLWSELDEFEKLSKRKAYLLVQRGMGEDVSNELKMVKNRLRNSGFAPLVNDGQFTAFTDDLEADNETVIDTIIEKYIAKDVEDEKIIREIFTEAYTRFQASTRDGGPLEDYIREVKMEYMLENEVSPMKLPHQLRKISDIIYGSKGTSAHKIGEKLTIYGDVIPKRMILDKMVSDYQKQHNTSVPDIKMQEFLNELDEKFINYSYNTSGVQKWMEKVGGLWFLKYFLRHGKGYVDVAKKNPMSVIKQQMIPYAFGIDIADPTDTHLDHTVYENVIKNRWKGDELLDQIGEAIAPNIFMPFDISQGTFFKDAL